MFYLETEDKSPMGFTGTIIFELGCAFYNVFFKL